MLSNNRISELNALCARFRYDVIKLIAEAGSGHPGGSLSVCEILTALYMETADVELNRSDRDRIVLTKGHAAPMLYRVLAHKGFFPEEDLKTYKRIDSHLQGHPSAASTPGVELSTGPLGIGLSASLGMALALKLDGLKGRVYAVMGDGELNEGCVWEAAMAAYKFKADNLIAIVDNNGLQLDGPASEIMPMIDIGEKFRAFGWRVLKCDGHDIAALCETLEDAKQTEGLPCVVIASTVKGKGVSFMEGNYLWHGMPIDAEHLDLALAELGGRI